MARYFRSLPFFVVLLFTAAGAMLVPAVYGGAVGDFDSARVFLDVGILTGILALLLGFATQGAAKGETSQRYLLTLLLSYLWLPAVLAIPMAETIPDTRAINVYFDMVSALTTTGATVFEPARLADTVHLWRATVGWLGGLFALATAAAILAPMNLGGFELLTGASAGQGAIGAGPVLRLPDAGARLSRAVTLIQAEHLPAIAALAGLDRVDPADLRRNLAVSGINLAALRGQRFRVGSAVLKGVENCAPCSRMEEVLGRGGYNAMRGHGGITAIVLEEGDVSLGDAVEALPGADSQFVAED